MSQIPQYELEADAFLNDCYHEKGAIIEFTGVPAWYMIARNEAAEAAKKKHKTVYCDPINQLTTLNAALSKAQDILA